MYTLIGVALNLILASAVLILLSSLFLGVEKKSTTKQPKKSDQTLQRISQSITLSLVFISLVGYNLPKFGVNPRKPFELLGLILVLIFLNSVRRIKSINLRMITPTLLVALVSASWNIIPGLIVLSKNGVLLGMTSIFNNDISSYAGIATEVLESGFNNSNHYFDYNVNQFASIYIYQTPNSLIQFFSSVTSLEPWKIMMPVMIFAVSYFSISINRLIRMIFPNLGSFKANFIAFFLPIIPIFGYISTNYFLGQILASAIILQIISVNIDLWKTNIINFRMQIEITGLFILSIYVYPHLLLPIFALALGLNLARIIINRINVQKMALQLLLVLFLTILVSSPYLKACYELIKTQSQISAGWPLPIFNPVSLFIYPSLLHYEISKWINLVLWAIFIAICIYLLKKISLPKEGFEKKITILLASITVALWIVVISIRGRELSEYSSWKLFTYLLPILLCVLLPLILMNHKFGKNILYLLLGLSISFPLSTWQPYFKNQLFTSSSFVNAVENDRVNELEHLNIDLGYYFESMNAALIIRGPQIYLPGPTYYNKSFNENACTLVWNTNRSHGPVVPLNESYGLALGKNSNCK